MPYFARDPNAYFRAYAAKRPSRKKGGRRVLRRRIMAKAKNVHDFKVCMDNGEQNATAMAGLATNTHSFTISDVTATHSEYASLFDQYRIRGIKIEYIPLFNAVQVATAGEEMPMLISCIDKDGGSDNAAADILSRTNGRKSILSRKVSIYIKGPKTKSVVASSAGTDHKVNPGSQWMDFGSTDITYHGFQSDILGSIPTNAKWHKFTTYYFQCKVQR